MIEDWGFQTNITLTMPRLTLPGPVKYFHDSKGKKKNSPVWCNVWEGDPCSLILQSPLIVMHACYVQITTLPCLSLWHINMVPSQNLDVTFGDVTRASSTLTPEGSSKPSGFRKCTIFLFNFVCIDLVCLSIFGTELLVQS